MLHRLRLEAGQARVQHGDDNVRQVFAVLSGSQKGLDAELLEPPVRLRVCGATHDRNHFLCQLERSTLKLDATRGNVEAETKVDVQNMTCVINHNVSVVTILELKEVGDDAVGCHTLDKVVAGFLESNGILAAVLGDKVVVETIHGFTTKHVAGYRVWQDVDDTTAWCGRSDSVRVDKDIQTDVIKDATEGSNHLQSQNILAAVVSDLEDG